LRVGLNRSQVGLPKTKPDASVRNVRVSGFGSKKDPSGWSQRSQGRSFSIGGKKSVEAERVANGNIPDNRESEGAEPIHPPKLSCREKGKSWGKFHRGG